MKIKHSLKLISSLLLIILFILSFYAIEGVSANGFPPGCSTPYGIPQQCSDDGEYEPDFSCINARFLNPNLECCPNKCKGQSPVVEVEDPSEYREFNLFGSRILLDLASEDTIPVIINIAISTILGLISIYALFRAIYVAAFVRTTEIDPARITAIHIELRNLLIGFILAWGAIFIVQLVANIIGLGSLQDLKISGLEDAYVVTIK